MKFIRIPLDHLINLRLSRSVYSQYCLPHPSPILCSLVIPGVDGMMVLENEVHCMRCYLGTEDGSLSGNSNGRNYEYINEEKNR